MRLLKGELCCKTRRLKGGPLLWRGERKATATNERICNLG